MLKKSSSGVLASLKASTYLPCTPRPFARCGLAGRPFEHPANHSDPSSDLCNV